MLAMQAQDWPGALWALGLRSRAALPDVENAFNSGELVRSWPLRGTLHVVPAEDLGWLLRLAAPRQLGPTMVRRQQFLGITQTVLKQARQVAIDSLTGGRALTREQLTSCFQDAGIRLQRGWKYHLIWYLSQTGTLVFGPIRDGEQLLVLADEWITAPRELRPSEALAELAARYVSSHGPATVDDLAWWSGLGKRSAADGLALADGPVKAVSGANGRTYWVRADMPIPVPPLESTDVHLLPGFDECIIGYADRSPVLPDAHAAKLCPGGNAVFRPTVCAAGVCVATWQGIAPAALRRLADESSMPVSVAAFTNSDAKRLAKSALQAAADAYAHFLGRPAAVVTTSVYEA